MWITRLMATPVGLSLTLTAVAAPAATAAAPHRASVEATASLNWADH
ncbi:hypothetical protein [Actinomadura oligospora]|nr:hypothetical protein [Actinomadura oligospora]